MTHVTPLVGIQHNAVQDKPEVDGGTHRHHFDSCWQQFVAHFKFTCACTCVHILALHSLQCTFVDSILSLWGGFWHVESAQNAIKKFPKTVDAISLWAIALPNILRWVKQSTSVQNRGPILMPLFIILEHSQRATKKVMYLQQKREKNPIKEKGDGKGKRVRRRGGLADLSHKKLLASGACQPERSEKFKR